MPVRWNANPRARNTLAKLVEAWQGVNIPPAELAGMLTAASAGYHRAKVEQDRVPAVLTSDRNNLGAQRKCRLSHAGAARRDPQVADLLCARRDQRDIRGPVELHGRRGSPAEM